MLSYSVIRWVRFLLSYQFWWSPRKHLLFIFVVHIEWVYCFRKGKKFLNEVKKITLYAYNWKVYFKLVYQQIWMVIWKSNTSVWMYGYLPVMSSKGFKAVAVQMRPPFCYLVKNGSELTCLPHLYHAYTPVLQCFSSSSAWSSAAFCSKSSSCY